MAKPFTCCGHAQHLRRHVYEPTTLRLADSALAWLTLAQQQVGQVESLVEAGTEQAHVYREIATLRAQLRHTCAALAELTEQAASE